MYSLSYVKAKSVKEAVAFLARNPEAKLMSGGMTLIPTLKQRLAKPTHVVDIARLAELRGIAVKGGKLTVGAATRHQEVASSAVVKKAIPAVAYTASLIGDPQVRNRGTIGGSLANNDPAADYPAAVLGLGATVVTTKRSIAADDFFQGLFTTALEEGEVILRVEFPLPKRAAYSKFPPPGLGLRDGGRVHRADGGRRARGGHRCGPRRVPVEGGGGRAFEKLQAGGARGTQARCQRPQYRHSRGQRVPRQPGAGDGKARAGEANRQEIIAADERR